jgi:FixJ family two-component response regulator/signal transduction histidine kinase
MAAEVFANALDHKRAQEELASATRFEKRISGVLASLLTSEAGERGGEIEAGLAEIAVHFRARRATLWQRDGDANGFTSSARWLAEGVPPDTDFLRAERLPWLCAELVAGRVVHFANRAELPAAAREDLAALHALAIDQAVIAPLKAGRHVIGALSFVDWSVDFEWHDALTPRIALLGEVFATVLARDAAERRAREAQAQAAHAARVGAMGTLAATMVHELTQPLAASLANSEAAAELLAMPAPDLDELRAAVGDIVVDGRRIGELIQRLRRFLRRSEAERVEIDVRHPLQDALQFVTEDAAARRVAIDVDIDPDVPRVAADRVQIQQVLLNLLSNACDTVAAMADDAARRVQVAVRRVDAGVAIEVADRGAGMDDATLARVFEPFFTTKPRGMGLGLAISRNIAVAHGGKLTVRSAVGRGTVFRLELPALAEAQPTGSPATAAPSPVDGIVYVVDDDPSLRNAVARQLRGAVAAVRTFDSARAFLDAPRESGAGCIVSDLRMPGLSGLDLQASLASAHCDLPFVFVSGRADVETTAHAMRAGAVDFLTKPVTRKALLSAVAEALAISRTRIARGEALADLRRRHDTLTPREREVFALVAEGLPNKLIADRLDAAEATVKIHRGRVTTKMNAASVAELARMAETLGLATAGSTRGHAASTGGEPA